MIFIDVFFLGKPISNGRRARWHISLDMPIGRPFGVGSRYDRVGGVRIGSNVVHDAGSNKVSSMRSAVGFIHSVQDLWRTWGKNTKIHLTRFLRFCYHFFLQAVPPVPELVRESGCICSVQELVRMERVLLKRINWDLNLVTPYTFLQLVRSYSMRKVVGFLRNRPRFSFFYEHSLSFLQMLAIGAPQNSHILMQTFRPLIELVSSSHPLTSGYRPSTLALAMFSIVLEWQRYPNWLAMTLNMEELIGVRTCDAKNYFLA